MSFIIFYFLTHISSSEEVFIWHSAILSLLSSPLLSSSESELIINKNSTQNVILFYKITSAYLHKEQALPNLRICENHMGGLLKQISGSCPWRFWFHRAEMKPKNLYFFPKLWAKADAVIQHTTTSSPGTEKSWNKITCLYFTGQHFSLTFSSLYLLKYYCIFFNNQCFIFN